MTKLMSILCSLVLVALSFSVSAQPTLSSPNAAPNGPGWYFLSICGTYGDATQWCGFGPYVYFGPFTDANQCTSTVTLYINTNNPLVTWPYAPSNCIYLN